MTLIRDYLISNGVLNGETRIKCPTCGPNRKKYWEKTLSVTLDDNTAVYKCHHCDESGAVRLEDHSDIRVEVIKPRNIIEVTQEDQTPLNIDQIKFLESRGISKETAERCNVRNTTVYLKQRKTRVDCISFNYRNTDGSRAVKYRDGRKNFSQRGSANSLWRIEEYNNWKDLVITEGELDALSIEEAGIPAVSVPNGAVNKLTKYDPSKEDAMSSKKFSYLWNSKEIIESVDRIILATDNDKPGELLSEEISRRVGKAKCWMVSYPSGCKDPNDVLIKYGPDTLKRCVEDATPWPVGGLRYASEYKSEAIEMFKNGMSRSVSPGVGGLEKIFRPSPQTVVICTGIPGSGKSTFLTWLSVRLAEKYQWPCAVFSAETTSQVHLLQIAALRCGKPFIGNNVPGSVRMTEKELSDGIDWANKYFIFLDESSTSIESIIERAQAAVLRNGIRIIIIDPYNFITSDSSFEETTASINKMLVKLKTFAVEHDIAVWLVAHPTKMYRTADGSVPMPGGYDISGSAAFFNVADNGLTVGRIEAGVSRIKSWKSRFPWIGSTGYVDLQFNPHTGVFSEKREWSGTPAEHYVEPDIDLEDDLDDEDFKIED